MFALDERVFYTCLNNTIACRKWEIAPGLELQSNSSQDRCVLFPSLTPRSHMKKETVDPCGSTVTRASASACLNENLYLMLRTQKTLLQLLSPVYFWRVTQITAPLGGFVASPWSVASVQLCSVRLVFAPPWKPAPVAWWHPLRRHRGWIPPFWRWARVPCGQDKCPHEAGAELSQLGPPVPQEASQNHLPGGNTRCPEQAAHGSSHQALGWKRKPVWCKSSLWLAGFFIILVHMAWELGI